MQVRADQLGDHLSGGLSPAYLVHGDDPLLTMEACQLVRDAAQHQGYTERQVFTVDRSFDWQALSGYSQSMSLFAERRLLELRLPTGKPGTAGSEMLSAMAAQADPDTILLVWSGRLDKKAQSAKWVKALAATGAIVPVYPLSQNELPGWVRRRMQKLELDAEPAVADLLTYRYEGNLLALSQELEKLSLLFGNSRVTVTDIEGSAGEDARFDVFRLVDTCLNGDGPATVRALAGLRAEGVAPVLILWALVREIRSLTQMAVELANGKSETQLFRDFRVWSSRQSLIRAALRRHPCGRWFALLQGAHRADKVIKGREPGDAWQALQALGLALSGVRLNAAR
jgi:DNA polymerase-3 subunit delta